MRLIITEDTPIGIEGSIFYNKLIDHEKNIMLEFPIKPDYMKVALAEQNGMKRNFIGIDNSDKYNKIAEKQMEAI